ncbi:hypothetical protein D3C73_772910 [compost metagenome]
MSQHDPSAAIPNSIDARYAGLHIPVNPDCTAGKLHPDVLQSQARSHWSPADGQQHFIRFYNMVAVPGGSDYPQSRRRLLDSLHLGLCVHLNAGACEFLPQALHNIAVHGCNQFGQHLNNRNLAAQAAVDTGELAADHPSANNAKALRYRRKRECLIACNNPFQLYAGNRHDRWL